MSQRLARGKGRRLAGAGRPSSGSATGGRTSSGTSPTSPRLRASPTLCDTRDEALARSRTALSRRALHDALRGGPRATRRRRRGRDRDARLDALRPRDRPRSRPASTCSSRSRSPPRRSRSSSSLSAAEATGPRPDARSHVPLQPARDRDQAHHRLGRARRDLLHLVEPREPRAPPARRERRLGPRPARLLDPPLLARRASGRGLGDEPELRAARRRRTSPSSTCVLRRARSPTSSSPGSRRASSGGRRSSARRRWSSTTTRPTSRSGSSTPGATCPDPETFGEYHLSYRTGDIVSPRVDATEPLSLRAGRLLRARSATGTRLVSSARTRSRRRPDDRVRRSLARPTAESRCAWPANRGATLDEALRDANRGARGPSRRSDDDDVPRRNGRSIGTAILGGGPAGLTAAYVLGRRGRPGAVFEADGTVGGHRQDGRVQRLPLRPRRPPLLHEARSRSQQPLGGDARRRVPDPAAPLAHLLRRQVLRLPAHARRTSSARLGLVRVARAARSRTSGAGAIAPTEAETFEEWVTTRFGRRLYDAFFRSYTEKVWGIPGLGDPLAVGGAADQELLARQGDPDHARPAARARDDADRGVPLPAARARARCGRRSPTRVEERGIPVHLEQRCVAIQHATAASRASSCRPNGERARVRGRRASSRASPLTRARARASTRRRRRRSQTARATLRYRDLVPRRADDDARPSRSPTTGSTCTIPETRAGRVQNFGAWSADMVRPGTTCLGVEYFCFEGDEIWEMSDEEAVELATRGARAHRADRPRAGHRRGEGAGAEGLPDVRLELRRGGRDAPRLPRALREPPDVSAATACTATTTRITRCGRRFSRR